MLVGGKYGIVGERLKEWYSSDVIPLSETTCIHTAYCIVGTADCTVKVDLNSVCIDQPASEDRIQYQFGLKVSGILACLQSLLHYGEVLYNCESRESY